MFSSIIGAYVPPNGNAEGRTNMAYFMIYSVALLECLFQNKQEPLPACQV
jgi:hypothetical protein